MPPKPNNKRGNHHNKQQQHNNGNHKKKEKSKQQKQKHKMPDSMIKRGNKREVVFDAEARRAHLRGFSDRKRQRRAFGLAMQKVKDRNEKIEMRATAKADRLELIEEAEKQKELWMEEAVRRNGYGESDDSDDDDDKGNGSKDQPHQKPKDIIDTKVYDDKKTETSWGGQVTVTTSVIELDGDDSDSDDDADDHPRRAKSKSVDTAQKRAGDVQKFMNQLKGNMPGKKNRDGGHRGKRKGKDGAADMKGVGGGGNLKIASKLLNRSKDSRSVGGSKQQRAGKKGKKGKR